jgi:DNA-binding beta-propeller fold protein YncE
MFHLGACQSLVPFLESRRIDFGVDQRVVPCVDDGLGGDFLVMRHILLLLPVVLATFADNTASKILTIAGTGKPGASGDGGPADKAELNQPFDVAYDASGNLFLSDTFNHRVRRIDAKSGLITTVAGNGRKGFSGDGGPATKAQLDEPYGIVLDSQGNLFIADRLNRRIRRVDGKTGVITTLVGDGSKTTGGDGGPAERATLVEPNGVALDRGGKHLYIADVAGHRVRVVDLVSGVITTFAGTGQARHTGDGGPASAASIHGARAVDVSPDGTVYILEREGNSLRAVDPKTNVIRRFAGTGAKGYDGDGGPALSATFNGPKELCVDAEGNILIVDTENHAIRRIEGKTGVISTVAGDGRKAGPGEGSTRLARPHGVAVGLQGEIVIGDTENHRIGRAGR